MSLNTKSFFKKLVLLGVCFTMIVALFVYNRTKANKEVFVSEGIPSDMVVDKQTLHNNVAALNQNNLNINSNNVIDNKELSSDELQKFSVVFSQINRFFELGKMEESQIDNFREFMWQMGDRAVETAGNQLAIVTSDNPVDKQTARNAIDYIDYLRYIIQYSSNNSRAKEIIEKLATRTVEWLENGDMIDKAKASITLECFQIFSLSQPEDAERFILTQHDSVKPAYIYNYILGKKIAGNDEQTVINNSILVFGKEFVNKALKI